MDSERKLHAFFRQTLIAQLDCRLFMCCLTIFEYPSDDTDCVLAAFVPVAR
jgi:hypothetical protein